MKKQRKEIVEFWRFAFCMAVFLMHLCVKFEKPYFNAGYLGVEFFFILSGYGVAAFYQKKMSEKQFAEKLNQLGLYIGSRIKRLYPLYFAALLLTLLIRSVFEHYGVNGILTHLKNGWAEFLMLQCGPLGNEVLISADWYVAAVFWGGIVLIVLLMLTGKIGGLLICPLLSVGIYGYYLKLIGKIDVIFSYHAVLRGIAGLSLGIFVYFIVELTKSVKVSKGENQKQDKVFLLPQWVEWTLFVVVNVILTGILVYTNYGRRCPVDFVVIALFAVALFLMMRSEIECPEALGKVMRIMGKVTYPIYIFHMPVIEFILYIVK